MNVNLRHLFPCTSKNLPDFAKSRIRAKSSKELICYELIIYPYIFIFSFYSFLKGTKINDDCYKILSQKQNQYVKLSLKSNDVYLTE